MIGIKTCGVVLLGLTAIGMTFQARQNDGSAALITCLENRTKVLVQEKVNLTQENQRLQNVIESLSYWQNRMIEEDINKLNQQRIALNKK